MSSSTLTQLQTLSGHTDRAWFVRWSPEGDVLASCSGDRTVRLWAPGGPPDQPYRCIGILEDMHSRTVRSCDWSPDGRYLATASFDRTVAIWKRQGSQHGEDTVWENVALLEGHENEVKGVSWNPFSGSLLATCGRDKTVWIWEVLPGNEFEVVDVKHGHSQDVKTVVWHPSGEFLVSASYDDSIKVWIESEDEWSCCQTLEGPGLGHTSTVWSVAFCKEGGTSSDVLMASASEDRTLKLWSCANWKNRGSSEPYFKCIATVSGYHDRAVYSVDWSVQGHLATASADNSICVFACWKGTGSTRVREIFTGSEKGSMVELLVKKENAHPCDVNCVAWNPKDGGLLASAGDDGCIKLWRLETR